MQQQQQRAGTGAWGTSQGFLTAAGLQLWIDSDALRAAEMDAEAFRMKEQTERMEREQRKEAGQEKKAGQEGLWKAFDWSISDVKDAGELFRTCLPGHKNRDAKKEE